jgi:hypothetical protein
MVTSSAGLGPVNDCSGKEQKQLYSKLQTRPFVREDVPDQGTCNCQIQRKNLVMSSRWEHDTKTDSPINRLS